MNSKDYLQLLEEMADLHKRKSAGYSGAENPDPWANFRGSEKLGIKPSVGALIRLQDKVARIQALVRNPANDQVGESIEDTLMDAAAYCLITICLLREEQAAAEKRTKDGGVAGGGWVLHRCTHEPKCSDPWKCSDYIHTGMGL